MSTEIKKTIRTWTLALVALGGGVACGGPGLDQELDSADGEGEAISSSSPAYVTLRHDMRRCISPVCGGYWLQDLNRTTAEVYVSALDFSRSGLDEATIQLVRETPLEDLVLRGQLGPRDAGFSTRPLRVLGAWRGLPGITRNPSDRFYSVRANIPPIQCIAAPCNNDNSTLLNRGTRRTFTGVEVTQVLRPFVDPAWVVGRVEHAGALVAGHFESGQTFPAGTESLLVATQVYVQLPDVQGPCAYPPVQQCPEGLINVWGRNADRCQYPTGCAQPLLCPQFIPNCAEGYTMDSFPAQPGGCPAFVCDPTFILPPAPPPSRCQTVRCTADTHCVEDGPTACVPNLTCAAILCGPDTHCVYQGGQDAQCVAFNWTPETVSVASANPYRNNEHSEWVYTSETSGADGVRIHFSRFDLESGYDFVTILDSNGVELARFTGQLGEFTTQSFPGSSVRIVFSSDFSITKSGFAIDRVDSRTL